MLTNYLSSHPAVRCHHEPFRKRGWHPDLRCYNNSLDALDHITKHGLSISNYRRVVSCAQSLLKRSTGNTIVAPWKTLPKDGLEGFKITWAQAQAMQAPFNHWLGKQEHLRVILLSRQDVLARYVSYELAQKSGVWHASSATKTPVKLTIDPQKFRVFCALQETQKNSMKTLLRQTNNNFIDVNYEDLVASTDETMHHIFDFLGTIAPQKLLHTTTKLVRSSLRDVITNYSELEQQGLL